MNDDLISRAAAIDAVKKNTFRLTFAEEQNCEGHVAWSENAVYSDVIEGALLELPSAQPEIKTDGDTISRQEAIDAISVAQADLHNAYAVGLIRAQKIISELPSAQPFHNITMNDVLEYIDGMPEDVWQEFTACLECRGWELQRRTAKWCGGEFA